MEYMIKKSTITLVARIFLITLIIGIILWFYTHKEKYEYNGIKVYRRSDSLLTQFINHFGKQPKKKRVNKTEEICRKILQKIYGKPFPSIRPDFLKSPMTKKNLELDCFCEELMIALEYNGQQHYTYTPYYHKNKRDFFSQVHRDDWKRKKCKELGIKLIEIPYWIPEIELEAYITKELKNKDCL